MKATVLVCGAVTLFGAVVRAQESIPRPDHIVIVVEENRAFKRVMGSASAPYINSLAAQGVLFTRSYGIRHPSQPNYLALFSGSLQGVKSDSCPHTFNAPNLGSELITAGFSFAGYSESMPVAGYKGCRTGPYTRSHNPWVNFTNLADSVNLRLEDFPSDFNALPTVAFVIPNKKMTCTTARLRKATSGCTIISTATCNGRRRTTACSSSPGMKANEEARK